MSWQVEPAISSYENQANPHIDLKMADSLGAIGRGSNGRAVFLRAIVSDLHRLHEGGTAQRGLYLSE